MCLMQCYHVLVNTRGVSVEYQCKVLCGACVLYTDVCCCGLTWCKQVAKRCMYKGQRNFSKGRGSSVLKFKK